MFLALPCPSLRVPHNICNLNLYSRRHLDLSSSSSLLLLYDMQRIDPAKIPLIHGRIRSEFFIHSNTGQCRVHELYTGSDQTEVLQKCQSRKYLVRCSAVRCCAVAREIYYGRIFDALREPLPTRSFFSFILSMHRTDDLSKSRP